MHRSRANPEGGIPLLPIAVIAALAAAGWWFDQQSKKAKAAVLPPPVPSTGLTSQQAPRQAVINYADTGLAVTGAKGQTTFYGCGMGAGRNSTILGPGMDWPTGGSVNVAERV